MEAVAVQWDDPGRREEALAWAAKVVGRPTGPVEQPHAYPWATVLRLPTSEGVLWLKAMSAEHAFEAALAPALDRAFPGRVAAVVAADPVRGLLLMRDAGTRLRDLAAGREQLGHWEDVLPRYAELQLALEPLGEELLALGVPDERLARLPERLAGLLEDEDALLLGHPEGLGLEQLARLRAALPEVEEICAQIGAAGIGDTLQHDDLHDGQVFVDADGRHRILDWGDACVSHPFHTLAVTLRSIAYKLRLEPGAPELVRLRDAYLEPFGGRGLVPTFALAHRTGTLGRALAWHRYVRARPGAVDADDAASVPYGLRLFLANRPIGAWEP